MVPSSNENTSLCKFMKFYELEFSKCLFHEINSYLPYCSSSCANTTSLVQLQTSAHPETLINCDRAHVILTLTPTTAPSPLFRMSKFLTPEKKGHSMSPIPYFFISFRRVPATIVLVLDDFQHLFRDKAIVLCHGLHWLDE